MQNSLLQRLPNGHSLFAPSAAGRWTTCPGSIQLIDALIKKAEKLKIKPEPMSIYAAEGTLMHEVAANILNGKKPPKINSIHKLDNYSIKYTKEFQEAVQQYTDVVYYFQKHFPGKLYIEHLVTMSSYGFPTIGGTVDCAIDSMPVLVLLDYKGGAGVLVEALNNKQLMTYSGMFTGKLGLYDKIINVIVQPRHRNSNFYDMVEYSGKELDEYMNDVVIASINDALSNNPSFNPSENACRWCEAKQAMACEAFAKFGFRTAQKDFESFKEFKPMELYNLSPEEMKDILKALPLMNDFISAFNLYALTQMQKGIKIPEYELKEGRSIRKWIEEEKKMIKILKSEFGLKHSDIFTKKLNSPTVIEKLLRGESLEKLPTYIIKPKGKPTIAPISDSRKTVTPENTPQKEFENHAELPDFFN